MQEYLNRFVPQVRLSCLAHFPAHYANQKDNPRPPPQRLALTSVSKDTDFLYQTDLTP